MARAQTALRELHQGPGRTAGQVQPQRLTRGGQGGVGQRKTESFADYLCRGRRPQELAAAARAGAGPAAQHGRFFQTDLAARKASAQTLDFPGIFAFGGRQGHASGHQDHREIATGRQGHHHGRQTLVAGGHSQHAGSGRQRADEAAENLGCVVAVGQAVHHSGGALGSPVARVGDKAGERQNQQAP